jgi:signal transduction histidine kinase
MAVSSAIKRRPGILVGSALFTRWLHVALVALVLASAIRYVQGHGFEGRTWFVLAGALLLLVVYALGQRSSGGTAMLWFAILIGGWIGLAILAPSFSWAAVPLVFVALRLLPFRWAVGVTVLLVAVVIVAWSRMTGQLDPTVVLGPVCISVLAVAAYRTLERDAETRRALLADLEDAQSEIIEAERQVGVVAERARLSREIHDSVAQNLTSINLLLQAASQDMNGQPQPAQAHVRQAAEMARESLDEVRRVVRDLAPAELEESGGEALVGAVRNLAATVMRMHELAVDVHVHGDPRPVPGAVATAVVRTTRGALANVAEHASATAVSVSLTFLDDAVTSDIRDDGVGFQPEQVVSAGATGLRGRGIAGMRARARELGGELTVESTPGDGTVIAASFPLGQPRER